MRRLEQYLFRGSDLGAVTPVELHVHSSYTDGEDSVRTMVEKACDQGLKVVGFAEHVNAASKYWNDFIGELSAIREEFAGQIDLFCGIEVKVIDYQGGLDLPASPLMGVEFTIGVVHSIPKRSGGFHSFKDLTFEKVAQSEYEALQGLIETGSCDIIGHIGGVTRSKYGLFPRNYRRKLLALARDHNVVVEFNASHNPEVEEWLEDLQWSNVLVSIGSDAHSYAELGLAYNLIRRHTLGVR